MQLYMIFVLLDDTITRDDFDNRQPTIIDVLLFHSERLPQSLLPKCTIPPFCEATALCLKVQMKDEWTWAPSCMSLSKDKHLFLHKPIILAMITNCYALLLGIWFLMTLVTVPQLSGRNNWTGKYINIPKAWILNGTVCLSWAPTIPMKNTPSGHLSSVSAWSSSDGSFLSFFLFPNVFLDAPMLFLHGLS